MDGIDRLPVNNLNWHSIELPLIVVKPNDTIIFKNDSFITCFGNVISTFSDFAELISISGENQKKYSVQDFISLAKTAGILEASFQNKPVRINLLFDENYLLIFLNERRDSSTRAISSDLRDVINDFDIIIEQRDEQIAKLYSSEKYYRQIVEAANVVIVRFDNQFKITDFGGSAEKVFGFKKKDVIGRSLFATIVPPLESSGRDLTSMMDQLLSGIRDFKYNINENITKKGKRIWMQWYNSQINDDSGELIDILSIGIDITDKILSEHALRESEERFRTLSDLTFEGILIHDEGIIEDINLSLEKQVGYRRKELVGRSIFDLLIPPENHLEVIENIKNDSAHYESVARHKNGTLIPIAIEGRKIKLRNKILRVAAIRNISELKKTINELKSSEEQLSVIFDSAPVIMMLVNEKKEIIRINETGKKSLLKKRLIKKKLCLNLNYHEADDPFQYEKNDPECVLIKIIQETFNKDKDVDRLEGTMLMKVNGRKEKRYYQASSVNIRDSIARIALIVMEDITERVEMMQKLDKHQHHLEELVMKRTQELGTKNNQLEFEKNQLRTLIDNIPDFIYIKDNKSRFINANRQLIVMMGAKNLENLVGKTDFDFFPQKLAAEFYEDEQYILKTGKAIIGKEEPGLDINKKPIHVLTTKVPLTDANGNRNFIVGIGRDITDKKEFELKLKEQTENLKKINALLEARSKEVEKLYEELKLSNTKLESANNELIDQKEELLTTLEKLKLTQTQLIQSEKLASLGILSSGIAHEINNPVNFVYAGVNSVMKDMEDLVPVVNALKTLDVNGIEIESKIRKIKELKEQYQFDEAFEAINSTLQDIKLGATRITQIVAGLSRYSRSSREDWQQADIHEEIENVLVLLKNKYKNKVEIIKHYAPLPLIECSPGKLNQALMNIINNAIDAIENTGRIIITTKHSSDKIGISISDTGKGMTDDERNKIFDPFFTTKEVGKGLGLGLYITYTIISDHNGLIHVNSAPGKGSEFIITLPVKHEK